MTVLPVIVRELRASARQPFTYYLRVLGVTAMLVVSLLFGLHFGFGPRVGRELFSALHCTLLAAIWVLVPMLTADCLSRERREGTLGLLFLTPLKGTDIVVAKTLAHGLRAVTLWLAVLPMLTIPFLVGGVSWAEAALSVLINANAMCWALAAGLLASAWSRAWLRALLLAGILACIFVVLFEAAAGFFLLSAHNARLPRHLELDWDHALVAGMGFVTNIRGQMWSSYSWGGLGFIAVVIAQTTVLSLLILTAAVLAAGAKTRRSWQEEPPSRRRLWWRQTFCTPVLWLAFFRRWMRHKLEHNPIGWLEQRTWSGRLVTWSWFAVLISIYSVVLTDRYFFEGADELHVTLAFLLAGSMALSAAGSFRRERESGVLELLLVSPVGENRIISGRLRGLWSQFVPAAGLLLAVWTYFSTFIPGGGNSGAMAFCLVMFLTVPVFGLYFSLLCRNFLIGFLGTVAVGLALPLVLGQALGAFWSSYVSRNSELIWGMSPLVLGAICQSFLALFCWSRLSHRLRKRAFPLERTDLR